MLMFENAVKKYGSQLALAGVSVNFERGRVYALVGPNGSGKSTLMKAAAGLVKLTNGTVTCDGNQIGPVSKQYVAYMSTEPFYYDFMRIKDVGVYYKDFFQDFDIGLYETMIRNMALGMDMKVRTLSSGMAAKLKIAATLARKSAYTLLDEPLNGIDILGRDQISNAIIQSASPDRCIIVSSHLIDELERIIENVVALDYGRLILAGNAEQIREQTGKSITALYRELYSRPLI